MSDSKTKAPTEIKDEPEVGEKNGSEKEPVATTTPAQVSAKTTDSKQTAADEKSKQPDAADMPAKKPLITWDRSIDVLKLVATVWVALLGSLVTMQFNERQHELNRIEAIAQMLPHMAENTKDKTGEPDHMGRDGAIWAIFRTANNRKMLRDLAALFPADIYRVVSSIGIGGELDHDSDALVALQVSSEKLATEYSANPQKAATASKLYAQALALKTRTVDDPSPLHVLDLTSQPSDAKPTDDQLAGLIKSMNDLADQHLKDIDAPSTKRKSTGGHWESRQLYLRAKRLGDENKDEQVQEQVMRADLALATLYVSDQLADDAYLYLKDALECEKQITGKSTEELVKALDKDGNGYLALPELHQAIKDAQERLKGILLNYKDKGAQMK